MLMAVKNQLKVCLLAFKYGVMREMLNKVSFIMNVLFMVLNNASFMLLWVIFYSLKDDIGGSSFNNVVLLWGIAASTYGFSHVLFKGAYNISDVINTGKLDAYIIQPKNILLQSIMGVSPSAFGDILYGYILVIATGCNIKQILLFTLFSITGGLILTAIAVIFGSLSFWFSKSTMITSSANSMMTQFATYPEGIFNKTIKLILYTVVPVGFANYLPLKIITDFSLNNLILVLLFTAILVALAFVIFYKGLRKYSSSNLMIARV